MFRWKATAATAAVLALTLSGCTASTNQDESSESLVLSTIIAPISFDATQAEWGNRSLYFQSVYDTLLLITPEGTLEPFLATDFSYNDDNTVLTLALRDDVVFTDGTEMTADVVKQNLLRFQAGGGPYASYLANVGSVDAPDETTVVITLTAPDPGLTTYLGREAGLVASPAGFDAADAATNPIGSGPYVLDTDATVTGSSYVFTKNPDYWNPDLQHYEDLTIKVISDPTAAVNAVKAGEANAVRLPDSLNFPEIEAAGWELNLNELDFQGLLLLDRAGEQNPALGDVRVRQAINHALDREGLLQGLQQGNGTVTSQVFNPESGGFDAALDARYPYDPEKAKELLAEAGYSDGLTIAMPSSVVLGTTSFSLIAQQLADVGITAEYTDTAPENYIADLVAPKYSAVYMTLEQNPDWQLTQFMISPTATFNPFHSTDPTVEKLITDMQHGDEETQAAKAKELNEYIVEQAWFAPFYRIQSAFASDAQTQVTIMPSNASPAIYGFAPKQ